jgi:signal peptidase I
MSRTQSYIDQYIQDRSTTTKPPPPAVQQQVAPQPTTSNLHPAPGPVIQKRPTDSEPRKKGGGLKYILFIFLIIGVIYFVVEPMDLAYYNINREYFYATTANGYSMEPTINSGDIVVVQQKDAPGFSLATGDILVFLYLLDDSVEEYDDIVDKSQYCIVGHTIMNIENGIYYTQGDGNAQPDPPVEGWQVVGKIWDNIPRYNLPKTWLISWLL